MRSMDDGRSPGWVQVKRDSDPTDNNSDTYK